jgi:hypothetical protein
MHGPVVKLVKTNLWRVHSEIPDDTYTNDILRIMIQLTLKEVAAETWRLCGSSWQKVTATLPIPSSKISSLSEFV